MESLDGRFEIASEGRVDGMANSSEGKGGGASTEHGDGCKKGGATVGCGERKASAALRAKVGSMVRPNGSKGKGNGAGTERGDGCKKGGAMVGYGEWKASTALQAKAGSTAWLNGLEGKGGDAGTERGDGCKKGGAMVSYREQKAARWDQRCRGCEGMTERPALREEGSGGGIEPGGWGRRKGMVLRGASCASGSEGGGSDASGCRRLGRFQRRRR